MPSMDFSSFFRGLDSAKAKYLETARVATGQFGNHVIGDAQELAPVATAALKASGTAGDAVLVGEGVHQDIGFNTDYAAAVHENLEARHDQGEAKFLENALRQNTEKFLPFVKGKIEEGGF